MAIISTLLSTVQTTADYSASNDLVGQIKAIHQAAISAGALITIVSDSVGDATHGRVLKIKMGTSTHLSVYIVDYSGGYVLRICHSNIDGTYQTSPAYQEQTVNVQNFTFRLMYGPNSIVTNMWENHNGSLSHTDVFTLTTSGLWVWFTGGFIYYPDKNIGSSNPMILVTPPIGLNEAGNFICYPVGIADTLDQVLHEMCLAVWGTKGLTLSSFYVDNASRNYWSSEVTGFLFGE